MLMKHLSWHTEKRKVKDLIPYELNPRKLPDEQAEKLKESLTKFDLVEIPAIDIDNKIVAGHQRMKILLLLGRGDEEIDVRVPNRALTKEEFKEYNIRSNLNIGDWDWSLLADIDESFLADVGFTSEQLDDIFQIDETVEEFDLEKELQKLDIQKIETQKGDVYSLGENRLMCGDSTIEGDILKLMNGEKADMCLTDEPYILDYVGAKRHGKPTTGFGAKRNRRYLETDVLPPNFISLTMLCHGKITSLLRSN